MIARALGVRGLEDYEPPSDTLAGLYDDGPIAPAAGPAERRAEVARFAAMTGGQVG